MKIAVLSNRGLLSFFLLANLFFSPFYASSQICDLNQLPSNLRNGLVAWYPFCGNANDMSGNGLNATLNQGTFVADRFSAANSAVSLNGTSQRIEFPINSRYNVTTFSVSFWTRGSSYNIHNKVQLGVGGGELRWSLNWATNSIDFRPMLCAGGYAASNNSFNNIGVPLNQWNHVVYVVEGTVTKVYVNGVYAGLRNTASALTCFSSSMKLCFGGDIGGGTIEYYQGIFDDIFYYDRSLTSCEVTQLYNATLTSIPTNTTLSYNPLQDTTKICGTTTTLDAGPGYSTYTWNTGATIQTISPTGSGFYKVTTTNSAGCTASDSTYLSLVNADIINRDTTICLGTSLTLSIDSLFPGRNLCSVNQLPSSLRNGLIGYWPFCGNANDISGNGNHGVVNGATLVKDRFGSDNSAYQFNGTNNNIRVPNSSSLSSVVSDVTISGWFYSIGTNLALVCKSGIGANDGDYRVYVYPSSPYSISTILNGQEYTSNISYQRSTWNHLVVTKSSTEVKVYLNGSLFATASPANTFYVSRVNDLFFGFDPWSMLEYFNGKLDDIGIWSRALSLSEINQLYTLPPSVTWSTGATTNSITVSPSIATTYYVDVSDGIQTCRDNVRVAVSVLSNYDVFPDTLKICGASTTLNAGSGYANYAWNNGANTQVITASTGGKYIVTVTNSAGCVASDSVYLSIINANILNNDTAICLGASVTLGIDSLFPNRSVCATSQIPLTLRNGLVGYWPFCGNANDISGSNNHATVVGATLAPDRFGQANSSYLLNGTSQYLSAVVNNLPSTTRTTSVWFRTPNALHPGITLSYGGDGNCGTSYFLGINHRSSGKFMVSGHCGANETQLTYPFVANQWYHLVTSSSSTGTKIYVNGQLQVSSPQQFSTTGNKLFIGALNSHNGQDPILGDSNGLPWLGEIDDVMIYNRELTPTEVQSIYNSQYSVSWSNGAISNSITVSPTQTTTYYVTITDGIGTCTDNVTVTVNQIPPFNPLADTIRICGTSATLDAGAGFTTYAWNTGAASQTISATTSGTYSITVTKNGCSAIDSAYVSIVSANILNSDTTICKGSSITLTTVSQSSTNSLSGWQLLVPSTSYNSSLVNFQSGSFDPYNSKLYSVNNSIVYLFDLNNNSVQTLTSTNAPSGSLSTYSYDFTNNRLVANRVGRETVYAMPATGGSWSSIGGGSFDAESYGCVSYWNPATNRYGFFSGYGYYAVKNWVWESAGSAWTNTYVNNNGCTPPKRSATQLARNADGRKIYIFSGQGSCNGNQTASSCTLGTGWATDVGVYCWLRDIWELDLTNFTFRNILPVNSSSITKQGSFSYDFENNTFYNFGGYVPSPTYNSNFGNTAIFTNEVFRYRVGIDNGFQQISVAGTPPPHLTVNSYGGMSYYDAKYDRVIWARKDGIWALNLGGTISFTTGLSYLWSTGDTTASINVSPLQSTTYTVTITDGITTCTDSVTVFVNDIDATITALDTTTICSNNGQVRLQTSSSGGNFQWLKDGVAIVGANDPLYIATTTGSYQLIIQGSYGCVDTSNAIQVTIYAQPIGGFTINDSIQCLRGNQFNFNSTSTLSTGSMSYQWNFGNSTSSTQANPVINYTSVGTYTVTLIVNSNNGCKDTVYRQVTIHHSPTAQYSVNTPAQCLPDNSFYFTSSSSIPSGTITHLWSLGDGTTSTLSSTTHSYATHGTYNVHLLVTSDKGCTDSVIQLITVHPKPIVGFSVNDSAQCLNSNNFIFTNNTSIASGSMTYFWSFGDGNTAATFNATHTYQYSRLYAVLLKVTSNNGCVDSLVRNVAIDPNPTVNFTVNNSSQCLVGNQFQFNNLSFIPNGSLTHQWSFGNSATSNLQSPSYIYASAGTYSVTLTSTSLQGCSTSSVQQVNVNPMPTGTLLVPVSTILCEGSSVPLTATGGTTYQWFLNGTSIPGATNAVYAAVEPGTYTVNVISNNGCISSVSGAVTLQLVSRPVVDFIYDKYCAGFPTQFTDQSTITNNTITSYSWSFGAGQGSSSIKNPLYTYNTAGIYSVSLTVTPAICPSLATTFTKPISIVAAPPNERYPSLNAIENTPLQLQARQFDNAIFSWSPGLGLSNAGIDNPIFNYNNEVEYFITISLPIGCVIKDSLLVRIFKAKEIFVPKGFSPNGDGNNDVIFPRLVGVKKLNYFKVYNRWGQLVFQTATQNNGWDGIYRGTKQPTETYVWQAEGIDIDDMIIKRTGTFILIR